MNNLQAKKLIESFLIEDIGSDDLSANLVFNDDNMGSGIFLSKSEGVFCGADIIKLTYEAFNADIKIKLFKNDGDVVKRGDIIAEVSGNVKALLSCERVILNLLQRTSGIATATHNAIKTLDDESIRVCDTRKTIPGLRIFEKYAIRCGGGYNHRIGLYDGVMLKDNHIAFAGGITKAVNLVRSKIGHMVKIEVETETEEQVKEAVCAKADIIMFDNRTPEQIKQLVKLVPESIITEASGGISIDNINKFKGCGVNYISIGALTHSVMPLDISFNSKGVKKA